MVNDFDTEFLKYHEANPHVYEFIHNFAKEAMHKGRNKFGMAPIIERVRWYMLIDIQKTDQFKINDHHKSRYVRKLILEHPEFREFFNLRRLKHDSIFAIEGIDY